jgi:hypothetical protein
MGMATNDKHDLDNDKIEAFFKSPVGFWISVSAVGLIALGGIILSFTGGA